MPRDIQSIKGEFRRLLDEGNSQAIIDLLAPLVDSQAVLSTDETGWVYWNIRDAYAMLRKAQKQYRYQAAFFEWGKTSLLLLRLYWVVSDASQAMTLIDGGYLDFWWHCYLFANELVSCALENRTVRFESHRASAAAYTRFKEFRSAETVRILVNAAI